MPGGGTVVAYSSSCCAGFLVFGFYFGRARITTTTTVVYGSLNSPGINIVIFRNHRRSCRQGDARYHHTLLRGDHEGAPTVAGIFPLNASGHHTLRQTFTTPFVEAQHWGTTRETGGGKDKSTGFLSPCTRYNGKKQLVRRTVSSRGWKTLVSVLVV